MQMVLFLISMCILAGAAFDQQTTPPLPVAEEVEYTCPMYCTGDISFTPAYCRVCAMEMEDRRVVENSSDYSIFSPRDVLRKNRVGMLAYSNITGSGPN
jgi:hypothetical protein